MKTLLVHEDRKLNWVLDNGKVASVLVKRGSYPFKDANIVPVLMVAKKDGVRAIHTVPVDFQRLYAIKDSIEVLH